MKSRGAQVLAVLFGLGLLTIAVAGCRTSSEDDSISRMVDVGGHQLFVSCVGAGPLTVVLEAGLGEGASDGYWGVVPDEARGSARICLYDRAGLGQSSSGPTPRSSERIAAELHTLLQNLELAPPYVLVGHSMGGLHIQVFADRYPFEVSGMVLVDPTPAELMTEPLKPEQLNSLIAAGASPGVMAEADAGIANSIQQWALLGPLPNVPVVVLTSSAPPQGAPAIDVERWESLRGFHQALADEVTDGVHTIASTAGHNIQLDEPDLVVDAIRLVVGKVR